MKTYEVNWAEIDEFLMHIHASLRTKKVFGIPKNGLILAQRLALHAPSVQLVEDVKEADVILDDVLASGKTMEHFRRWNPTASLLVMFDKRDDDVLKLGWLKFPWEDYEKDKGDVIVRIIELIGDDPNRSGLLETPERVVKSWLELYRGYTVSNPGLLLKKQFNMHILADEMIIVKDINVFSTCEHHLLPFIGKAHIGYIPDGNKVVGASKIPRLVDAFARRLQIQERLTRQIATTFMEVVKPQGVAVVLECQHLCMKIRGCRESNSSLTTSAMLGVFRVNQAARNEFLNRIK